MKALYPSKTAAFCGIHTGRLLLRLFMSAVGAVLILYANAQSYYPGGIGNSNLKLWLTAADPTTLINPSGTQAASGDFIAQWLDKSANGHHAIQSTSGDQPIKQGSLLNGNAGVIFQNTSEYLTGPSSAYQTLVAVRSYSPENWHTLFASPANTDFSLRSYTALAYASGSPNGNDWMYNTGTSPANWVNGVQTLNAGNTNHIVVSTAASPRNQTYSLSTSFLGRGMYNNDPVFELLSYSAPLTTTQRRILENYEAATWGLESVLPTSNYTIFTPPAIGLYNQHLVGIGYTSSSDNFLTNPATSTDGLGLSSGTGSTDFLNAAGYIMAAHNGQANSTLTNTTIAGIGSGVNLWNRCWYVQQAGGNSSGNISLNFNFNSYNGGSLPGSTPNFYLLYNATDGSFASGTNIILAVDNSAAANNVIFTVSASLLATGYYTILWPSSSTQIITPVAESVCSGSNASFSVLTTNGFNYQWQVNTGSGFSNVPASDPGGATYSGAATADLMISGVTTGMTGYTYQCVLMPASGPNVTLGPSQLTVNSSPVVGPITGTSSVLEGGTTSLSDATAGGIWASSNTNVATINSGGTATGVAYGSSTITYTVTNSNTCSTSGTLIFNVLASHYFPGGLGNSNLNLWLDAADPMTLQNAAGAIASNGNSLAIWVDKSGNSNNALQYTSGDQPLMVSNLLNGNGGVEFQNTSEYMNGLRGGSYQTIVAVRNFTGSAINTLFAAPGNTDFSIREGGGGTAYANGSPNGNDWTYNTGSPVTNWVNGVQTLNVTNANHILVAAAAAVTAGNISYSLSTTFLTRGMTGNEAVYELFAYNTTLNTTQRRILENYAAARWGLGAVLPTSGYTMFTPPSAGTYNKNLVGIGYTSAADNFLVNPVAASNGSTDGLGFSSGSGSTDFLNTPGYVMAAHNGQSNTIITNATLPGITGSNVSLWNRSWYLQATGGNPTGLVTLNFNFQDYDFGSVPSLSYNYQLLYNATDGTFNSGTNVLVNNNSITLSSSNVAFVVKVSNLPVGYYTIVWSPVLLALGLTGFSAVQQGSTGFIQWTTVYAANVNSFDIQRRSDRSAFVTIGTVGANTIGNGSDSGQTRRQSYSFRDMDPFEDKNYYRLMVINDDGSSSYSTTCTLYFVAADAVSLKLYPNPVADILEVSANNLPGLTKVRLMSADGRIVRSVEGNLQTPLYITMGGLASGLYVVDIWNNGNRFTRKVLKQ